MDDTDVVLEFFLGDDDDPERVASHQFHDGSALPGKGDRVQIWGTRDDQGNYVHEHPQKEMEGIVARIDHVYEQRGNSAQTWRLVHFVSVFLKPKEGE